MNDKGFSLIELLVAVAISTIIIASVGQAMVMGMRHYSMANSEATLQERAQIVMNVLQDEIIDAPKRPRFEGRSLVIPHVASDVNDPEQEAKNNSQFFIDYDGEEYVLSYKQVDNGTVSDPELLVSGLTYFKCDIGEASVKIEFNLEEANRSYKAANSVYMRNHESFDLLDENEIIEWRKEDGV